MDTPGSHILDIICLTDNPKIVDTGNDRYIGDMYITEDLRENTSFLLSNVVKKIIVSNNAQLIKLRIGYDDRYLSDSNIRDFIVELSDKKLLDKHEIKKLFTMSDEEAKKYVRELSKIRWRATEVILGVKELRAGKRITFSEAVEKSGVVKLSVVAWSMHLMQRVNITYLLGGIAKEPKKHNQTLRDIKTLKKMREPISQMVMKVLEFSREIPQCCAICDDIMKLWVAHKRYDSFDYNRFYQCLDEIEKSI